MSTLCRYPPMRILHTADWHLGHRLYDRERTEEHRAALDWLLDTIEREQVDLLIVAGDVFDVTNPSNQARELYYDFLGRLLRTGCSAAVVVGGNHDSAAMLDAPSGLLRSLQLHVVGAARTPVQSEVVRIEVGRSDPQAVFVAAVPYLRERDLRKGTFGGDTDERLATLRNGIRDHYRAVAAAAEKLRDDPTLPILATGHLFASGAEDDAEKKSHIYQADEHNIEGGQFPECFDYVALGHVHRAQSVDGRAHVRYSGSLVPLTFVEGQRPRSVRLVELGRAGDPVTSRKLEVPFARALHRLRGTLDEVRAELTTLVVRAREESPTLVPWVEIRILSDAPVPNLRQTLDEVVRETADGRGAAGPVEVVRLSTARLTPAPATAAPLPQRLDEIDPADVFARLLDATGTPDEVQRELLADFRDLRNWQSEQSAEA